MALRLFPITVALLALALASSLPAAGLSLRPRTEPGSGIDMRLESWLEICPPSGMVPVRIEVINRSGSAHSWEVSSHDGMGGHTFTGTMGVSAEPGHTSHAMMYVPTRSGTDRSPSYRNLNFSVHGHGLTSGFIGGLRSNGYSSGNSTEFIAMSTTLGSKGWSNLKSRFDPSSSSTTSRRRSTSELDGCEVAMADAPADWRGYSGLAQLWMSDGDWMSMGEASKAAMMEWVALGGKVMLMGADVSDARLDQMKLPAGHGAERKHGLGSVKAWTWDGSTLPMDDMVGAITGAGNDSFRKQLGGYASAWSLRKSVGELGLKHGLIFGFVAAFGILMGPINLFLLAPASRRHRLFVTVPLISLLGSAILVALMILQDGIGGNGARFTLALLMPEQKRMLLKQEQVSRTGVLLARAFKVDEQSWMQPLELGEHEVYRRSQEQNRQYTETPSDRSGDWFTSRAVQGQILMASRPTRAAFEFTPGSGTTPPTIISSVEVPLTKLFVLDATRQVWTAEDVGQGEKKPLKASTKAEFDAWVKSQTATAGPVLAASLRTLSSREGYAFAESSAGSKIALKSLDSIRWDTDRVLFAGPCLKH